MLGAYYHFIPMKPKSKSREASLPGCSKAQLARVVDKTDEVSYLYLRQGEADGFEEIFEEY